MPEVPFILAAVFLAAIVQATSGFGFGLVVVGVLSLACPIKSAVIYNVIPGLTINSILVWRLRRYLCWDHLRWIAVATLCCTPLGVLLRERLDATVMQVILAVILIATLLQALLRSRWAQRPWHPVWLGVPMGGISGLLAGAYGTGGPPLVGFVRSRPMDRYQSMVSIQVLLGLAGGVRVVALLAGQSMQPRQWAINGLSVLVVLPGIWIGLRLLRVLSERWVRCIVLLMLAVILLRTLARLI